MPLSKKNGRFASHQPRGISPPGLFPPRVRSLRLAKTPALRGTHKKDIHQDTSFSLKKLVRTRVRLPYYSSSPIGCQDPLAKIMGVATDRFSGIFRPAETLYGFYKDPPLPGTRPFISSMRVPVAEKISCSCSCRDGQSAPAYSLWQPWECG